MTTHHHKRRYSEIQTRRCSKALSDLIGDGSGLNAPEHIFLIERIHALPSRSLRPSTLDGGESFRSSGSILGHMYASTEGSRGSPIHWSGNRDSPAHWSGSRSTNDVSRASNRSKQSTDPPRPAKPGYEWVWFPEGYWAEREVIGYAAMSKWARRAANESLDSRASGETSRSRVSEGSGVWSRKESPTAQMLEHRNSGLKGDVCGSVSGRPEQRRASTSPVKSVRKLAGKLQAMPPHFWSPEGESEGLYHKALRVLGSDASRKAKRSDQLSGETRTTEQTPTPTKETLNATSSYFSQWKRASTTDPERSPDADSAKTPRKGIGLAPWRRKNSHDTAWSATSSIKALVMGRTPMGSPSPRSDFGGKEPTTYFQVDVSPNGHNVTPLMTPAPVGTGMADQLRGMYLDTGTPLVKTIQRVNTPPMIIETPGGKARGFFFDLTPSSASVSNPQNSSSRNSYDFNRPSHSNSQTSQSHASSRGSKPTTPGVSFEARQWWDGDEDTIVTRAERRPVTRGSFVLDIPEHLPSSPLCPMNPKHKGGGRGICPYHGRKKSEIVEASNGVSGGKKMSQIMVGVGAGVGKKKVA